jgi:septal ring-binding cell division protein DamX
MREHRLGDDIDDFCVRCKRLTNHLVVSVMNAEPAKVRCRTCHSDHDYRREQAPPPKVDLRKAALFNEVLKKVDPEAAPVAVAAPVAAAPVEVVVETVVEPAVEEAAAPAPVVTAKVKAKPAAKAKPVPRAKGKART